MDRAIYSAASGAVAQEKALESVSHNVANATTTGFRAERVTFAEVLANEDGKHAAQVRVAAKSPDVRQGSVAGTENPLDLALDGQGYFALGSAAGARYTRSGNFLRNADGMMVSTEGLPVLGQGGEPIMLPESLDKISIGEDGIIDVDGTEIGRVMIMNFAPQDLETEGKNFVPVSGASPIASEAPRIVSGSIERGNFNIVQGMVELIRVSRTYEALTKVIQGYREIDARTARDIGNAG